MEVPGPCEPMRAGLARIRACLSLCSVSILAGCQVPAARITDTEPNGVLRSPPAVLARQIVADTALQLACHPLRSGKVLLSESVDHLRAAGEGTIGKRILMPLWSAPGPVQEDRSAISPDVLEDEMCGLVGPELQPARIDLYPDPNEALTALKQIINGASRRIDVLMFQWENDSVGAAVATWLAAKAGPSLPVRVLVDGGGNLIFGEPEHRPQPDVNRVVSALAQQPHVEVIRTRNPLARFDHRKLVLVDGHVAWTGGRNFTRKAFYCQRDLSFTLAGPLVAEWQKCFDAFWEEQGGTAVGSGQWAVGSEETKPVRDSGVTDTDPMKIVPLPTAHCPLPTTANALARLVYTAPCDHQLAEVLYRAVDRAEHHVYIENFTFGDSRLIYKLAQTRRRGVDVRVVMTLTDGTRVVNGANRVLANRLLQAGVRVYIDPGMTHVKAASVDGCWAYLGSGNFDGMSMRHNRELGVAVGGGPLVRELEERLFLIDFQPDWELHHPLPVEFRDYLCEILICLCM